MPTNQSLQSRIKLIQIVWGFCFSSVFSFLFVAHRAVGSFEFNDFSPLLKGSGIVFCFMSVLAAIVGAIFPVKRFLKVLTQGQSIDASNKDAILGKLYTAHVIRYAIIEASLIYGLVLCFLVRINFMWLFSFLTMLIFISAFPSSQKIRTVLQSVPGGLSESN